MFLVRISKRLILQKFNLQCSLDINRHSFTDSTEKFPAFLNKLNDITKNVCQSQLDSPLVVTNHDSSVYAKKLLKLVKMQWINAI